jgi:hypothetical protein
MAITHIAGQRIIIDNFVRQRCAWCGAVLVDQDVTHIAVMTSDDPGVHDPGVPTWPVGALVTLDGNAAWVVEGNRMPADACGKLDPAVTR